MAERKSFRETVRRALIGAPIATSQAHTERLTPFVGLPVFSSDALSSVAYASEAILSVLVLFSIAALDQLIPISLAIVGLIAIITFSYRQTIIAYPSGGGSYIVASENLGTKAGLVAGAALLIDYILTVSVSIAAGVDSILSAFPGVRTHIVDAPVTLSIFFIAVVAFANLRGLKESGTLFMIPTYGFVLTLAVVLGYSMFHVGQTPVHPSIVVAPKAGIEHNFPFMFVVLRAFAAGCTALTGIEAVSNGVQAFRPPETKNANKTLLWMSSILTVLVLGMGYVASHLPSRGAGLTIYDSSDSQYRTLIAQIAAFAFGENSAMYLAVLIFTAAILILAANTAFADFPRLASLIARDGFLPRYLARQGDKLVFHNGIMLLATFSIALVIIFAGKLDALLPLYAVGVFTAFTLSQAGMVMHWWRLRETGWVRSLVINLVGALLCAVVLTIIAVTKFTEGAWLVLILIPIIYQVFRLIKSRYDAISRQLTYEPRDFDPVATENLTLLLVPRLHKGIFSALRYAKNLSGTCKALHVTINEKSLPELMRGWDRLDAGIPLVVIPSPYRSLIDPLLAYLDEIHAKSPNTVITVVVPEAVSSKWFQRLLTENVAQQIKVALSKRENIVVANVRYFLN